MSPVNHPAVFILVFVVIGVGIVYAWLRYRAERAEEERKAAIAASFEKDARIRAEVAADQERFDARMARDSEGASAPDKIEPPRSRPPAPRSHHAKHK